ncbi:DUF1800 family protein [Phycicoccus sp. MAQZ13P-2]|uniref:DUF1800 domain-containing protein n=1 Tax=Phycicoccus mangrovi TaxID=2840470 RepID=UPI001C0054D5|nr:DUF1800 domain-containing protein [Phycicoccus mangrovi]MBT9257036.1 DUF1800 family protein [Phycicoccus mangrovi]MBT9275474.1 DUF1800 family protein [Phycicoccus mangrovi]
MSSPLPPRRAATLQAILGATTAGADPSAPAKKAAKAAATRTRLPAPTPPRSVAPAGVVVPTKAPAARSVDAAYAPRVALGGTTPRVAAARPPRYKAVRPVAPRAVSGGTTSTAAALLLARRATWGATPEVVDAITAMGASAWVEAQLAPKGIADPVVDDLIATQFPRLSWQTWEVRDRYWPNQTGDLGYDTVEAYAARAIWSTRQLLEVMVDFWSNHLVVTAPWGETWDCVHRFHEDVIRKNALGRYVDMLVAAAMHPAMLAQLDNESSSKRAPNENFGRELLELHTVGVTGGYVESDIRTSALVLTGISTEPETGEYFYRYNRHHTGQVGLLGWSSANTSSRGEAVGVSYLQHLARHPSTARRLATKLAVRFVSDTPPSSLVDSLAQVYLANDTAIAPVLRALFASTEFAESAGRKTKRPLERIVSVARALGVKPGANTRGWLGDLTWNARVAGQAPLAWPAPNGYPDVAAAWSGAGATLAGWNFAMHQGWSAADTNEKRVVYPALRGLLPSTLPATHGAAVDALATRLVFAPLPAAKRDAICAFLGKTATTPLKSTDSLVGWRLPYVVALVLDTPEFATR